MVFQYNPLEHYVEVNDEGELIFTINRGAVISPKIRYNAHDQGGVLNYNEMKKCLADFNIDIKSLDTKSKFQLKFPFIWVYGRRDFTISIMGANIYPEDIEQCIYADAELSKITCSFCQSIAEKEDSKVRPALYFEINTAPSKELELKFQASITGNLKKINMDYKEAWKEYSEVLLPEIHLYRTGEGPFKMENGQIKQKRLLKNDHLK
jgi:phenylacetate-CoA ligase